MHYKRKLRNGDPAIVIRVRNDDVKRFWLKVTKGDSDECWNWTASTNIRGYGAFKLGSTHVQAHRYSYEILVAPIPPELTVDHLCRNILCVNPAHMEIVSRSENLRRLWVWRKEVGWRPGTSLPSSIIPQERPCA